MKSLKSNKYLFYLFFFLFFEKKCNMPTNKSLMKTRWNFIVIKWTQCREHVEIPKDIYFKFEHNFDRLCYHRPPRSTNPSFGWLAMNSFICSMHFWVGQKIVTESEGSERVSLCDVIATRLLDPILVDDESIWLCLLLSFSVLGFNGKVSAMTNRLNNKITTQW